MIWVTLTPIEIEFCDQLAIDILAMRRLTGSQHTNNRRVSPARELAEGQIGTRCECAGKTYLWQTAWHIEIVQKAGELANLPDLEHPRAKIDVKGVPFHDRQLISPAKAIKPDWFYLLISAQEHPRYWLRGWCKGEALAQAPLKELQPNRWCHAILPGALLHPQELFNHLQGSK